MNELLDVIDDYQSRFGKLDIVVFGMDDATAKKLAEKLREALDTGRRLTSNELKPFRIDIPDDVVI